MGGKAKEVPRSQTASALRSKLWREDTAKERAVQSTLEWRKRNQKAVKEYSEKWRRTNNGIVSRLLSAARKRAHETNKEFSITTDDVFVPELCPLLCIPIIVGRGKQGPNSPTIDRIDSVLGYVPGNVWIVSQKANRIKSDASPEEIMLLARNLSVLVNMRKGCVF